MKTNLLCILLFFTFSLSYAQITFEKGYFIDNSNQKTDCLIKNMDWKNNPSVFQYKLSQGGEIQNASMDQVSEFGFISDLKYKRYTVSIDRASDLTSELTKEQKPEYKKETLFLKVLSEGEANLYYYEDGNLRKFFFDKNDVEVQPLIYKRYLAAETQIGTNTRFRQQLLSVLNCDDISRGRIENISYKEQELEKIFDDYNTCRNPEDLTETRKKRKALLNFNLRPGVSFSSILIENRSPLVGELNAGSATSLRLGGELEVLLPFNKNKWALTLEPFYKGHSSDNDKDPDYNVKAEYQSIIISAGVRHYIFLNKNSKIFINGNFGIDLPLNSSFEFERKEGTLQLPAKLESNSNILDNYWSFGIGLNVNNRWSAECRYETPQNLLVGFNNWRTEYGGVSLILGYTFF